MTRPVPSLLVVDDDDDIRESFAEALTDEGYDVITATDGRNALDVLAQERQPHVILLDLMMPRMDGSTFRARQLLDARIASIPVIVMSAAADAAEQARRMQCAYLKKPVTIDSLVSAVESSPAPR